MLYQFFKKEKYKNFQNRDLKIVLIKKKCVLVKALISLNNALHTLDNFIIKNLPNAYSMPNTRGFWKYKKVNDKAPVPQEHAVQLGTQGNT